jgi:hypothetical protein
MGRPTHTACLAASESKRGVRARFRSRLASVLLRTLPVRTRHMRSRYWVRVSIKSRPFVEFPA